LSQVAVAVVREFIQQQVVVEQVVFSTQLHNQWEHLLKL
jgi:ribosomal protein L31E